MLAQHGRQRLAVVEVDVDPDARVRTGHARHVAERPADRRERVVPVDARLAGLHHEQVREHVRQVAREREQPVVHAGVDGHGRGAERRHQAVQVAQARRLGLGQRREVPGGALEQLRARVLGAARLHAAERMTADEARAQGRGHRRDDARLGRPDVGDRRAGRELGQLGQHGRERRDRRAQDDEIGAGYRAVARSPAASSTQPRSSAAARAPSSGSQPTIRAHAGALARSQAERAAHQAQPDDRETLDHGSRASPRISSARRKARSSDWRAFRRGSQSVM